MFWVKNTNKTSKKKQQQQQQQQQQKKKKTKTKKKKKNIIKKKKKKKPLIKVNKSCAPQKLRKENILLLNKLIRTHTKKKPLPSDPSDSP